MAFLSPALILLVDLRAWGRRKGGEIQGKYVLSVSGYDEVSNHLSVDVSSCCNSNLNEKQKLSDWSRQIFENTDCDS